MLRAMLSSSIHSSSQKTQNIVSIVFGCIVIVVSSLGVLCQIIEFLVKKHTKGVSYWLMIMKFWAYWNMLLACFLTDFTILFNTDKKSTRLDMANSWVSVCTIAIVMFYAFIIFFQYFYYKIGNYVRREKEKKKSSDINVRLKSKDNAFIEEGTIGDETGDSEVDTEKTKLLSNIIINTAPSEQTTTVRTCDDDIQKDVESKRCGWVQKQLLPEKFVIVLELGIFFVFILFIVISTGLTVLFVPTLAINLPSWMNSDAFVIVLFVWAAIFMILQYLPQIILTFILGESGSLSVLMISILAVVDTAQMFYYIYAKQDYTVWIPQGVSGAEEIFLTLEIFGLWIYQKVKKRCRKEKKEKTSQ